MTVVENASSLRVCRGDVNQTTEPHTLPRTWSAGAEDAAADMQFFLGGVAQPTNMLLLLWCERTCEPEPWLSLVDPLDPDPLVHFFFPFLGVKNRNIQMSRRSNRHRV